MKYSYQGNLLKEFNITDVIDKQESLIYRETDNDHLLKLLNIDDNILDCGAHIGSFCIAASSLVNKIVCFEPNQTNFNLLNSNIKSNNIKNIETFQLGVWIKNENKILFIDKNRSMNATIYKKRTTTIEETIKLVDFKTILLNNPTLNVLKIDIEGAEYEIFMKYFDLIEKQFKHIAVEFHLDNVGVKTKDHSKRGDLKKWYDFNDLIKSKYNIISQRATKPTKWNMLYNGIDFITCTHK